MSKERGSGTAGLPVAGEAVAPAPHVVSDPWQRLRRLTGARVALGRAGDSLPTAAVLRFALDHAQARDAVHLPLDRDGLLARAREAGFAPLLVHSAAADRHEYLCRPDLGRRLDHASYARLLAAATSSGGSLPAAASPASAAASSVQYASTSASAGASTFAGPDVVFVLADGLSARAVHAHGLALLGATLRHLTGWSIGPLVIAEQSRVALGDEIGELLRAQQVVVLIGERPGLSSPDSLGAYLTYAPHVGRHDAERNCVSNVRAEGLSYAVAGHKLAYLLEAARRLRLSGVKLKDESPGLSELPGNS